MTSRLEKLQERIKDIAGCGIITDDIDRRYFTSMKSSAGTLVVFPEKSYLLIDFRYIEKAKKTARGCEVILESGGMKKVCARIKELMQKHGAESAAVDIEKCTVSGLVDYKQLLGCEIIANEKFGQAIRSIRLIKSAEETEKMIAAQRIAEKGFEHMLEFIKVGRTEREIQLELDYFMLSHGAEALSFDTIALSGKNTSLPHGVPSDKAVEDGDFVLMDYGAVVDGYHSDMTRTVCVGKPDEEMARVYDIVLRAQKAALEAVRAGICGKELDKVARDIITAEGYGECFGHSLGHGVGVEIHEQPYASPNSNETLQEGSVVTIEPGIYIEGRFGVRIEDLVIVTQDGCVNMTKAEKTLISV